MVDKQTRASMEVVHYLFASTEMGSPGDFMTVYRVRALEKQRGPRHRNRDVLTALGAAYRARYLIDYRYTSSEYRR